MKKSETTVSIDPSVIYYTFSRICPCFSCGRTIEETKKEMESGNLSPTDLPLLLVFVDSRGDYFSQNNRRLYLYKTLREEGFLESIPVRLKPLPQTRRMAEKYSRDKCALTATLSHKKGKVGNGRSPGGDDDDDDDEEKDFGGSGPDKEPNVEEEEEKKKEEGSEHEGKHVKSQAEGARPKTDNPGPVPLSRTQEKKNKRLLKKQAKEEVA